MTRSLCQISSCPDHGKYCRRPGHTGFVVPEKKTIAKKSETQKELDKRFAKEKSKYLKAHPFCEAKIEGECQKVSMDVHHKKGKVGEDDYLNPAYFLACCRKCHTIIEANPRFAKDMGFSVSRLTKVKKAS